MPIPPELVGILRDHIAKFGVAEDGRLFRTASEGEVQDSHYTTTWKRARTTALSAEEVGSPLAARPYDLRHGAASLWLNSGVPATEVARRLGHGVGVLLKVYANCIDGEADAFNNRIDAALTGSTGSGKLDAGGPEPSAEDSPAAGHSRDAEPGRSE